MIETAFLALLLYWIFEDSAKQDQDVEDRLTKLESKKNA